jgi:hypothetical protein
MSGGYMAFGTTNVGSPLSFVVRFKATSFSSSDCAPLFTFSDTLLDSYPLTLIACATSPSVAPASFYSTDVNTKLDSAESFSTGVWSHVRTVQQNLPNWPISLLAPFWRRLSAAAFARTRFI